jgi:hypothetical protein
MVEKDRRQSGFPIELVRGTVEAGSSAKALVGATNVSLQVHEGTTKFWQDQRGQEECQQVRNNTVGDAVVHPVRNRTPSMMWITPFETSMSASMTLLPLTAIGSES